MAARSIVRGLFPTALGLILWVSASGCALHAQQPAVTEISTKPHLHSLLEAGVWTPELQALLNEPDADIYIHYRQRSAMDIGLASDNVDIQQYFEQRLSSQRAAIAEAHFHVLSNDVEALDALVRRGLYLNAHQFPASTTNLLYEAVRLQHTDMVSYLLGTGMNPGLARPSGWTALHVAVDNGYAEGVTMLLAAGAPVNAAINSGWTPLLLTLNADNDFPDIATQLVAAGADIEHALPSGTRTLMLAVQKQRLSSVTNLLALGANPEVQDEAGRTVLIHAIIRGFLPGIEALVRAGADPNNIVNHRSYPPVFFAIREQPYSVVELLLQLGSDPNQRAPDGRNAMHFLASRSDGSPDITRLLLENGADLHAIDDQGYQPLHLVAVANRLQSAELMLEFGADVNFPRVGSRTSALQLAAQMGHAEMIDLLIRFGADLNAKNDSTWTALMYAVDDGHLDAVHRLLAQGAAVNLTNSSKWSPLHFTVNFDNDYVAIAELLIEHGAFVDARQYTGYTPLHLAALGGHTNTLQVFAGAGADINNRHSTGRTPLMDAAEKGQFEAVALLLDLGANIDARSLEGETALQLARDHGHSHIVQLLMSR